MLLKVFTFTWIAIILNLFINDLAIFSNYLNINYNFLIIN